MEKEIVFELNKKPIPFKLSLKIIKKIPDDKGDLYNILISCNNYCVQSKVRDDIFKSYLLYWTDEKIPEINEGNILEYFQLSKEFGLL